MVLLLSDSLTRPDRQARGILPALPPIERHVDVPTDPNVDRGRPDLTDRLPAMRSGSSRGDLSAADVTPRLETLVAAGRRPDFGIADGVVLQKIGGAVFADSAKLDAHHRAFLPIH